MKNNIKAALFVFLLAVCVHAEQTTETAASISARIEAEFHLTVMPAGIDTPMGLTKAWSKEELQIILKALENLKKAVGEKNSHLWNAGGKIARAGEKTVGGQFGAVHPYAPEIMNVVVDLTKEKFSISTIAQRIAHESAHIWDFFNSPANSRMWSTSNQAKIFELCNVPAGYDQSFFDCRKKNPSWFSFHPTSFIAKNSAEFYGKMVEEWVREKQGIVPAGRYSRQNEVTQALWQELTENFKLKD